MNPNESILPEGYKTPSAVGNYMKLELGDNEFRVLSKPTMGWSYWNNDNKPVRIAGGPNEKPYVDANQIKVDKQGKREVKFFWAMVVFNYKSQTIQVLEVNQVSILKAIEDFLNNKNWGSYYKYDLNIKKTVEKDKTSYTVSTNPPSPVTEQAKIAYKDKGVINLSALFTGVDPFGGATTQAPVQQAPAPVAKPVHDPTVSLVQDSSDLPF